MLKIKELDLDEWNNGITEIPEGANSATISHTGGSDTTLYEGGSTGNDTTNLLVAQDLRARTNGNIVVTDSTEGFGITVSDVVDAGSASGSDDINDDDNVFLEFPYKILSQHYV